LPRAADGLILSGPPLGALAVLTSIQLDALLGWRVPARVRAKVSWQGKQGGDLFPRRPQGVPSVWLQGTGRYLTGKARRRPSLVETTTRSEAVGPETAGERNFTPGVGSV